MQNTLMQDINGSIASWYNYYLMANFVLVVLGLAIFISQLIALFSGNYARQTASVTLICGAILAWLNLSPGDFLTARNKLQLALYQYQIDHDKERLIKEYADAKELAKFIATPAEKVQTMEKGGRPPLNGQLLQISTNTALFSLLGTTYGGISAFTFGPGLDELGISIGGVRSPAAATLDGPIGQEDAADAPGRNITFPASAGGRAEQKVRPAGPGLGPGGDDLPDESKGPGASPALQPQNDGRPVHARAFDASEGTPLDPLRNKTYDLNYAKTVPPIQ